MKKYLLFLIIGAFYTNQGFTQTLRKCGCQTWRDWYKAEKKTEGSRREKKRKYASYRDQCLADCKTKKSNEEKDPKEKVELF